MNGELPWDRLPEAGGDSAEPAVLDRQLFWPLVCALPPRQRAVIVLRYYEDLSEAQIADALGCAPGTVKSLSSAAIGRCVEPWPRRASQRRWRSHEPHEQLRATLDQEAEMQKAPAPDVNPLISGGKVRRRRRNLLRLGVSSALAVVLVGGGGYAAQQIATSTEPEPAAQPPSATTPQELFAENLNLEPGTYRMVVGVDATGVEIVADLTLYGPDWIGGPNPTVVAHNGVHEYRARGGVGVYPPEALAGGSGCTNGATTAPATPPEPSPGS